jgi:hypothetical protein
MAMFPFSIRHLWESANRSFQRFYFTREAGLLGYLKRWYHSQTSPLPQRLASHRTVKRAISLAKIVQYSPYRFSQFFLKGSGSRKRMRMIN